MSKTAEATAEWVRGTEDGRPSRADRRECVPAHGRTAATPVSYNTFRRVKQWMRVRRAGRYLGQFDCSKCITYNKLQHKPMTELTGEEAQEMRRCRQHRITKNFNASSISRCGLISVRVSCSC